MESAQNKIIGRNEDTNENLFPRKATEELESDLTGDKHHVLVEVKVDQPTDLDLAVEAVGEEKLVDLIEVRNDEVSLGLHLLLLLVVTVGLG